jgi:hypothetical protein
MRRERNNRGLPHLNGLSQNGARFDLETILSKSANGFASGWANAKGSHTK